MRATPDLYREAWGRFATGVTIVSTQEPDGNIHAMTASGVASLSLNPMLALVTVDHRTHTYQHIQSSERFGISILNDTQQAIAIYYARSPERRTGEPPGKFIRTDHGTGIIDGALATLDCRIVSHLQAGDHTIYIGEVDDIVLADGRPLVYYSRGWYDLPDNSQ